MQLKDYLAQKVSSQPLQQIIEEIFSVIHKIAVTFPSMKEGYTGTENSFGDHQINMDVYANDCFVEVLSKNPSVALIGSEEIEVPLRFERNAEKVYSVVFDPLDGSSLVDANLAVGSIIGIYEGDEIIGQTGRNQVASIIAVYGPRTTVFFTVGKGVDEWLLLPQKDEVSFRLNHQNLTIPAKGKVFSPGNLKAALIQSWYFDLLNYWLQEGCTLRYSGGMVPDITQQFKKGGGVFVYPGTVEQPLGKLRLLYECAPLAFMVEQGGGKAMGLSSTILDIPIQEYHQKTFIVIGSAAEVEKVMEYVEKKE